MDLQEILMNVVFFINDYLIPVVVAIAGLVFLWNLFRYAILQGTSEEGRARSKKLMLWGVVGLVLMTSLWGVINILLITFSLDQSTPIPDYVKQRCAEFESSAEYEECLKIQGFAPEPSIENFNDGGQLPGGTPPSNRPFQVPGPFDGTSPLGASGIQPA